MKDQDFYNKESSIYSAKRYPEQATNYVQYFFKRRLAITIEQLKDYLGSQKELSLLEIGCADGVVMKEISRNVSSSFKEMTGIDTAPDMIVAAHKLNQGLNMNFFVRGEESKDVRYDVIIEIGVANYANFDEEISYISEHITTDGICVFSIAGRGSFNEMFNDAYGYKNFLTYGEYKARIQEIFTIKKVIPVGLFVPLLWKIPIIARTIQPVLEVVCRLMFGSLFHEKVYVLKKR